MHWIVVTHTQTNSCSNAKYILRSDNFQPASPPASASTNWKRRNDIVTNENVSIVEKWKINLKCQTINIPEFELRIYVLRTEMIKSYTTRYVTTRVVKKKNINGKYFFVACYDTYDK